MKEVNKVKLKKVWLAVLLNLIFPGAGYIYLGRRKYFAFMLFAVIILAGINRYFINPSIIHPSTLFEAVISVIFSIAFGFDAYTETKAYNAEVMTKK